MAGVCHVLVSGSCAVLMGVQIPPQSVSDCPADSAVGMSANVDLGFYFVHFEMCVCVMCCFFLPMLPQKNTSARECTPSTSQGQTTGEH